MLALVATWLFVPESPVRSPGQVNWLGAALLSVWLVCLLLGDQRGADLGLALAAHARPVRAALVLLLAWIRAEARSASRSST